MPEVRIQETVIREVGSNCLVRLFVSDAAREDDDYSIRIDISTAMSRYQSPLMVQLQRRAIENVLAVLHRLDEELLQDIPENVSANPKRIGRG